MECKRFNKKRKVGVKLVRELLGVVEDNTGVEGLLITTTEFSKDAIKMVARNENRISVKGFSQLKEMIEYAI